jgi:hypothetical protein
MLGKRARPVRAGGRWKRTRACGHLADGLPVLVHGGGFTTVGVYLSDGRLLLVVHDGNATEPRREYATGDDESGRGLALVDFLAARNGWEPTAQGKKVWAEFEVSGPSSAARDEVLRRRMKAAVPREPVRLPRAGFVAALLGIGVLSPAVILHGHVGDFLSAPQPPPVAAPDIEPPSA